jgi:Fe-S-cluster-containing dehydrogenase component
MSSLNQPACKRAEPSVAADGAEPTRRDFLSLMGASLALAGVAGCTRWPEEKLAPEAHRAENRAPGESKYYATAFELGGMGQGVLVKCVDGRPVKVEGNPLHPLNRGAADAIAQASVLELYDPDRSRGVIRREGGKRVESSWEEFAKWARENIPADGEGFCVLGEATNSPSMLDMRSRLQQAMPRTQWFEYEPISNDNERKGINYTFPFTFDQDWTVDRPSYVDDRPSYVEKSHQIKLFRLSNFSCVLELSKADVVVSVDADIFGDGNPLAIKYARDFASRRKLDDRATARSDDKQPPEMNRLYVIESLHTITGACADYRYAADPSEIVTFVEGLFKAIKGDQTDGAIRTAFMNRVVADLLAHAGRSVVIAGPRQSWQLHACVAAINHKLGNIGNAVQFYPEPESRQTPYRNTLDSLIELIQNGKVHTIAILGGNPVYNAPADFSFDEVLKKVPNRIRLAIYEDETSDSCTWHLSRKHYLESWGDARTYDGTISITHPLIEPLFDGRSAVELLAMILDDKEGLADSGEAIVRRAIKAAIGDSFSDWAWKKALADGIVEGSNWKSIPINELLSRLLIDIPEVPHELGVIGRNASLLLYADSKVYDGRFANNGWLQELPDPMTRLTWGNAALMSPAMADELPVHNDDIVSLEVEGLKPLLAPVLIVPGMADGVVGLALGYGRQFAGTIGDNVGANAYLLRSNFAMNLHSQCWIAVRPTGQKAKLATVQDHHVFDALGKRAIQDRIPEIVVEGTLEKYRADQSLGIEKTAAKSLFQEHKFDGRVDGRDAEGANPLGLPDHRFHRWGLIVDLSACTGCGACVVACQAENNIPIVGKEQVLLGREMHWIRVDRYFRDGDEPASVHQPVLCMHCQNAPCESVCPVAATTHSQEGINMMTYNRCVGVRYCLNNCPYKVRRFNFFDYNRGQLTDLYTPNLARRPISELLRMQKNPDVTVRMRGVMEKCNYCVQRIEHARIVARREGDRPIRDGEIQTACQQSCPAQAITFGDLNDPASRVSRLAAQARAYGLLDGYLHTEPRTRYLAKVRNASEKI